MLFRSAHTLNKAMIVLRIRARLQKGTGPHKAEEESRAIEAGHVLYGVNSRESLGGPLGSTSGTVTAGERHLVGAFGRSIGGAQPPCLDQAKSPVPLSALVMAAWYRIVRSLAGDLSPPSAQRPGHGGILEVLDLLLWSHSLNHRVNLCLPLMFPGDAVKALCRLLQAHRTPLPWASQWSIRHTH